MKLFEHCGRVYNADQICCIIPDDGRKDGHSSKVYFTLDVKYPTFTVEGTPIEVARLIKSWVDVGL